MFCDKFDLEFDGWRANSSVNSDKQEISLNGLLLHRRLLLNLCRLICFFVCSVNCDIILSRFKTKKLIIAVKNCYKVDKNGQKHSKEKIKQKMR